MKHFLAVLAGSEDKNYHPTVTLPCAEAPNAADEDFDPTYATLGTHEIAKPLPAKACKMRPSHGA